MKFQVGDIVRVKGIPGPHMVVQECEEGFTPPYVCLWYGTGQRLWRAGFAEALLELVPVEGEAKEPVFDQNPIANALAHKAFEEKVRQKVIADMTSAEDAIRFAHTEGVIVNG